MTSLPQSAVAWSAVCDCAISWPYSGADPESFVRRGPTLTMFYLFFVDAGIEDQNTTESGPSAAWPIVAQH